MSNTPDHYIERPAIIEEIRNEARGNTSSIKKRSPKLTSWQIQHPKKDSSGREPEFIIKSGNKWLREAVRKRDPKMLFDNFWLEGELCIMFADTNTGKSVLAVQIADSISKGKPIPGLQLTAPPCGVLYIDYELTDKQFQQRYNNVKNGNYKFSKKFSRGTTNTRADKMYKFSTYREYIENEIENSVLLAKAKVLIIDNISCLNYGTHAANGAFNLVRSLQTIKSKHNIAILALAHTPKRNPLKPVTGNDLQGSKMLLNFCDSAFAIAESQTNPGMRYLKQIKQRSTIRQYGAENVCMCSIEKQDNFLRFTFNGNNREAPHLQKQDAQYRKNTENRVTELLEQGLSIRQIAAEVNLSAATISRIKKKLEPAVIQEYEKVIETIIYNPTLV